MSGYPDHPVFDQGGISRETGFLQKPFSPHVLVQKVREVLDGVKACLNLHSVNPSESLDLQPRFRLSCPTTA